MAETRILRYEVDGKTYTCPEGTSYQEIAPLFQKEGHTPAALVRANGRLRELSKKVEDGVSLEFMDLATKAGHDTYVRSLLLLMLKAIYYETADNNMINRIGVHFAVSRGCFCTIEGEIELTAEFLERVKKRMRLLVEKKCAIRKRSEETWRVVQKFHDYRMYDKEELFRYRRGSRVNLYRMEGYEDYFYGYMLPDTSLLQWFDLRLFEDGFVILYPRRRTPDVMPEFEPAMKVFRTQRESMEWGKALGLPTVGALNTYVVNQDIQQLIMVQEAYHEKKIAQIASAIAADPRKKIILIAGPSSSGKTTFSHRLSTQLSVLGLHPHAIAVDDYFLDREKTPKDENGNYDFECLEAIDTEQFNRDMLALLAGEEVELPSFNFKTGKREYKGNRKRLKEGELLVIEGIHCLNDRLTSILPAECKFRIYISALTQLNIDEHNRIPTTDGRLLRRIVRDARSRGTSAENTIRMWPSVRHGEENNIFPYQESADMMFNSALIYELAVLKIYAEPLLFSVSSDSPEYDEAKRLLKFLDYFLPISPEDIPNNSLLREFIGGGCFGI